MASAGLCDSKKDEKKGKKPTKSTNSKHAAATATVTTLEEVVPPGQFNSEAKSVINKKRSGASTKNWDNLQEDLKKNREV